MEEVKNDSEVRLASKIQNMVENLFGVMNEEAADK